MKGEITMIISPFKDTDQIESEELFKSSNFNPNKDSLVKVNLLTIAEKLNQEVEMNESDFRVLLKNLFSDIPSYHINIIVRHVKQGNKKKKIQILSERLGGIM